MNVLWMKVLILGSLLQQVSCQEDLQQFFSIIQSILETTERAVELSDVNTVEYGHRHLERYVQIILAMVSLLAANGHNDLAQLLQNLEDNLTLYFHTLGCMIAACYTNTDTDGSKLACLKENSTGGRPRYKICPDLMSSLRELGFSWVGMARLFGVSESTIRRRRDEFGITSCFSDISDENLDKEIKDILESTPNSGETLVIGSLRGRGIRVQRNRIRE